jgi:dTDP-4-dehydrorhamnose 3,5-epimerase-like enzyme
MHFDSKKLPAGVCFLPLKRVQDDRGSLTFLEGGKEVPFEVKRVFWIYDIPEGKSRGAHAHRICHEALFPVSGSFTLMVDDGEVRTSFRMDSPHCGVLIPAGVWCELTDFAPGTVCVVMASHPYMAEGYVNEYNDYKEWRQNIL